MIDFHMHTTNSDGSDSVEEVLKKAEKLGLKVISITDHDTCKSYEDLKNINVEKIFSGKIVPGIEMKCSYKKRTIEVLGYYINTEKMQCWLNKFYKGKSKADLQRKYFNMLYDKCLQMDLKLSPKDEILWNPSQDWASVTIYKDLKKYQENETKVPEDMWNEFATFTRKYCANPNHILYMDKTADYPTLEEAIKAIKECDGLAFMPHLFIYKWVPNEEKKEFVEEIVNNYDIDGIECYYPDFSEEQKEFIVNLCNEKGLFISGGSDYHGTNKPERYELGGQNISKDIVSKWVKY